MSLAKLKLRWIMWLAGKLPPCNVIAEMVSESLEQKLSARQRIKKRLHFMICEWCSRYEQQLLTLRKSLRLYAEQADDSLPSLSPEARQRISKSLNRER